MVGASKIRRINSVSFFSANSCVRYSVGWMVRPRSCSAGWSMSKRSWKWSWSLTTIKSMSLFELSVPLAIDPNMNARFILVAWFCKQFAMTSRMPNVLMIKERRSEKTGFCLLAWKCFWLPSGVERTSPEDSSLSSSRCTAPLPALACRTTSLR